jgi:hypothetical protein
MSVVDVTEHCDVILSQDGFFARCEDCEWDSPLCHGRDTARREAQAHDSLFHDGQPS